MASFRLHLPLLSLLAQIAVEIFTLVLLSLPQPVVSMHLELLIHPHMQANVTLHRLLNLMTSEAHAVSLLPVPSTLISLFYRRIAGCSSSYLVRLPIYVQPGKRRCDSCKSKGQCHPWLRKEPK